MSELVRHPQERSRPSRGGGIWFIWMVGMWVAFFWLLFADSLDDVWRAISHWPILVEVVVWIALVPWMLGTWVWTSQWPTWIRVALVLCFAIGWTVVSMPRARKAARP